LTTFRYALAGYGAYEEIVKERADTEQGDSPLAQGPGRLGQKSGTLPLHPVYILTVTSRGPAPRIRTGKYKEGAMSELAAVNLGETSDAIKRDQKRVSILWQEPDTLAFVARGREYRSEFHIDPSDEVMYMIKGEMNLHYITPGGDRKVAIVREGEIIYCPAGTPHSPRFSPDSFLLVLERKRRPEEEDRFVWYCERCGAKLYETVKHVRDYREDPVSRVYEEFYSSEAHRTCAKCGHVTPRP
jgi:3-hydroxyanthranilate 3,4-dioxygenase